MPKKSMIKNVRFTKSKIALAIAAQMVFSGNVAGAPASGEIVGGIGGIEQKGTETTIIQSSDRLAIDWKSFDVGKNERVEFVQPGQSAVALNRILGNKGTEILGRIDANGHIILVNPRGVVFGESATINVGGLIASGLQINPDDFMNGDLVFKRIEDSDGTVINSGMINAASGGNVVLLGTQVENRGLISANLGSAILASGKEAVLTFDESGLLGVQVNEANLQQELGEGFAVSNSGEIRAENGRVLLSAATTRDVFSQAVNWGEQKQARSVTYNEDGSFTLGAGGDVTNSGAIIASGENGAGDIVVLGENITNRGAIRADTVRGRAGNIELHSNITTKVEGDGVVTANAEKGGDIKVLGKNVGLFDQAKIESIGNNGGGQVLFGGDREGLNSEIRNADFAYIGENTSIDVSATNNGDGGKAVIFAEDTARVHGSLAVKGGKYGGNGGFIETSGKIGFEIAESPDISAAAGKGGHWLIDPYNIVITSTGTADISGGNFESGKNDARIAVRDVNTALAQNGQVTIQTGRGAKEQDGNITVDAEINFDDDREATLNLIAYNNIEINYSITTGDKTANRKLNIHLNANTSGNQGSITFGNKVRIETGGGDFIVGNIQGESSSPGAFNVDFSNATIDVIRASYTGNELDQLYRNRGTTVTSEQSQHLAPSGRIAIAASNDVILGQMNVKGREDDGSPFKIDIRAGNDITLPQDLMFDNNPTEIFQSGQRSNDGYTTLHLMAGNDIRLNGGIRQEYSDTNAAWSDHHDRLNIVLVADSDGRGGGDVIIGNTIETSGGDFTILNAIDVEMDNNTLDTQSIYRTYDNSLMREIIANYGAGNVSITATGNVTLGDMPLFQQGASETSGQLRNPSLKVSAGETLDIGNSSLYTLDGGITLGAKQWNFNNHSLNTTLGGDITLTSAGNLLLPNIVSTGNLTLASRDAGQTISITGNGLQLNGLLTLDLKDGSANLSNVVSNSSENSANLTIASGHNIQLQTPQAIRLGDSVLTGDLNLTSDVDIRQVGNSSVNVGGSSRFYTGADVILNGLENLFGGSVWVGGVAGDARNINLVSTRDLKLGGVSPGDTNDISLAGTLEAHAGHDITQSGVLSVAQATTLSAGGDITLTQNNKFSSISISHAQSAKIRNQQALRLGEIVNVVRLELDVTGDLSQTAVLNLEELDLAVTGKTQLTQSSNSIGSLSGSVAQSNIAVAGDLKLGDFVVGNDGVFSLHLIGSEATLEVGGNIQLTGVATLTFNDVANFVLRGNVDGVDAVVNSLIVNGAEGNGTYEITAGASWKNISFSINGGEGNDTLKGPNSAATWRIDSESSSLSDGSNALTFSSIENLKGGSGEDAFEFLVLPEGVAIDGGDGTDVADYSRISDASVRLNSNVKGVEEIKGDGSGILVGGDVDTTWIVVAPKMGSVEWEYEIENAETIKDSVKFTGFSQLRGGSGTDYFILKEDFASVEDVESASGVYGGAGNDTFDFQSEFTAVVSGGAGDDTFILSDNARVLNIDGGSGRDKLSGIDGAHLVWEIDLKETVSVSDGQNVYVEKATNISSLEGKDGNDTFLFWAVKTNIGVNGGEGTNTANFSNVEGAFPVYLGSLDESGISNVSTIKGNGQSTLADRGDGGANWHLSSQGGEYKPAEGKIVKFSEFNQLVGGSGDDIFTFDADLPGAGANVNGGDGNNEYVFNVGFSANVTGGSGDDRFKVEEGALVTGILDGGLGGNNNLELYDKDLTWIIKAAAANTSVQVKDPLKDTTPVAAAFNITRLKGGEGEDTFKYFVHDRSISADGGRGVNTADFSGVKGKFEVRLGEESAEFGVTNIGHLIGNGATSTLIGSNQNNTWTLENNQDYGILKWGPEDNSQSTAFSGFGHWIGGNDKDIFILETLSGAPASIQGGGGNDELNLSAINETVKIGLGTDSSEALNLLDVRIMQII
jgi:filamentous hemagglutinin family protein